MIGPGETYDHKVPVDLSHLVYDDSWSRLLYGALLATSVVSVGISFSKVGLVLQICIHSYFLSMPPFSSAAGVRTQACGLQHCLITVSEAPGCDHFKVLCSELLSVNHC